MYTAGAWAIPAPPRRKAFLTELNKFPHLRWARYAVESDGSVSSLLAIAVPFETFAEWPALGLIESSDSREQGTTGWQSRHLGHVEEKGD